jgi:hypothetical protein
MPTRTAVITELPHARLVTWSGLLNTDDGNPFEGAEFADRTAQVFGTFGASGSVQLEGSNNGTNWNILTDPQGNALTFTTGRIEQVLELPRFIRPLVTAGDGTTNLTVSMFCRRGLR